MTVRNRFHDESISNRKGASSSHAHNTARMVLLVLSSFLMVATVNSEALPCASGTYVYRTNQTLTFPLLCAISRVDYQQCGGGGGGSGIMFVNVENTPIVIDFPATGGGGGDCKNKTVTNLLPPVRITLTIGKGGAGGPSITRDWGGVVRNSGQSGQPTTVSVYSLGGLFPVASDTAYPGSGGTSAVDFNRGPSYIQYYYGGAGGGNCGPGEQITNGTQPKRGDHCGGGDGAYRSNNGNNGQTVYIPAEDGNILPAGTGGGGGSVADNGKAGDAGPNQGPAAGACGSGGASAFYTTATTPHLRGTGGVCNGAGPGPGGGGSGGNINHYAGKPGGDGVVVLTITV